MRAGGLGSYRAHPKPLEKGCGALPPNLHPNARPICRGARRVMAGGQGRRRLVGAALGAQAGHWGGGVRVPHRALPGSGLRAPVGEGVLGRVPLRGQSQLLPRAPHSPGLPSWVCEPFSAERQGGRGLVLSRCCGASLGYPLLWGAQRVTAGAAGESRKRSPSPPPTPHPQQAPCELAPPKTHADPGQQGGRDSGFRPPGLSPPPNPVRGRTGRGRALSWGEAASPPGTSTGTGGRASLRGRSFAPRGPGLGSGAHSRRAGPGSGAGARAGPRE